MRSAKLSEMKGGWFAGDFSPACLKSKEFEAACKYYKAGAREGSHVHKVATEITVIAKGRAEMGGRVFAEGDVIILSPGDATDFHALEDTITMVVKVPSVAGDKYPA